MGDAPIPILTNDNAWNWPDLESDLVGVDGNNGLGIHPGKLVICSNLSKYAQNN